MQPTSVSSSCFTLPMLCYSVCVGFGLLWNSITRFASLALCFVHCFNQQTYYLAYLTSESMFWNKFILSGGFVTSVTNGRFLWLRQSVGVARVVEHVTNVTLVTTFSLTLGRICKRGVKGEKVSPHSGAGKISGDFLQNLVTEVTNKKKKKNKYNNNNNYK